MADFNVGRNGEAEIYLKSVYKKHMGFGYWLFARFDESMENAQVWWSDNPNDTGTHKIDSNGNIQFENTLISTDGFYI